MSDYRIVRETREQLSYTYVINAQLDRIARIRSLLVEEGVEISSSHFINKIFNYVKSVEALHAILLPELRGSSTQLLILANRVFDLERSTTRKEDGEAKEEEIEIMKLLGLWDEFKARGQCLVGELTMRIADKALEEMLVNLNRAGLLLPGRVVKVGATL